MRSPEVVGKRRKRRLWWAAVAQAVTANFEGRIIHQVRGKLSLHLRRLVGGLCAGGRVRTRFAERSVGNGTNTVNDVFMARYLGRSAEEVPGPWLKAFSGRGARMSRRNTAARLRRRPKASLELVKVQTARSYEWDTNSGGRTSKNPSYFQRWRPIGTNFKTSAAYGAGPAGIRGPRSQIHPLGSIRVGQPGRQVSDRARGSQAGDFNSLWLAAPWQRRRVWSGDACRRNIRLAKYAGARNRRRGTTHQTGTASRVHLPMPPWRFLKQGEGHAL